MNYLSKKFMKLQKHSGMVLMTSVILIVFVSIAVLGTATFVVARMKQVENQKIFAETVYLAQAGIHQALHDFRFHKLTGNGYFSKGQTNLDATRFFVLGANDADLLMVDTSTADLGGGANKDIVNLQIQNATNSHTITIDRIVVAWNNSVNLRSIRINGLNLWSGNQGSPVDADLSPDVTLNATSSIYQIDRLRFQNDMTGVTATAQFWMTDGSSKTVTIYPASNHNDFNIIAMGKTTVSNIYRTIQVTYNALTGHIIDSQEINVSLP